jgi:ribonuclease VapC
VIVDSSTVVAVIRNEPNADQILDVITSAPICRMSAANLLETCMIVDGSRDASTIRRATILLNRMQLGIEPVTEAQVDIARDAFRTYGKGSGHGARLNFGDCFAYALAKISGEPFLYIGDDFSRTDIPSALGPSPF